MALQTYNSINLKESISDNGLDLHCWIETIDGQIIDEHFEEYDLIKQVRNLTGDKIYCELVGEDKKKVWKYIYKNHIKEQIKNIEDLCCFGYDNWYSFWENFEEKFRHCFMNAYQYHLQNPKTTRLCFGKMGWKYKNNDNIWWEYG